MCEMDKGLEAVLAFPGEHSSASFRQRAARGSDLTDTKARDLSSPQPGAYSI
jgi:hypothetical protein